MARARAGAASQARPPDALPLAEPGAGPLLECEALVKIAYADQGSRDGLLANLTALIEDTTAKLRFGEMIARQYLDGRGPGVLQSPASWTPHQDSLLRAPHGFRRPRGR